MQGTRCVYACGAATVVKKFADGWGWVALSCCQPVLYRWAVDTWGQRCRMDMKLCCPVHADSCRSVYADLPHG
jgi:hypothetical protein